MNVTSTKTTDRFHECLVAPNTADDHDDADLLRRIATKDRKAFEALYQRYAPRLGRYLLKLLRKHEWVDEAVNDTLMTVWQNAARFDPKRARASTWLFGIAHHKGLKTLARANPRKWVTLDDDMDDGTSADKMAVHAALTSHDNPERIAMGAQMVQLLSSALATLSLEHRAVINLAFVEGFNYEDIARVMDCPVNTVKTRVFYARKQLAIVLPKFGLRHPADAAGVV